MWLFAGVCFAISTPWVRATLERVFAELSVVFFNSIVAVAAVVTAVFVAAVLFSLRDPTSSSVSEYRSVPLTSATSASKKVSSTANMMWNTCFFAATLLPLGVAVGQSSSASGTVSSAVPWSLADNATNLALLKANLTMCTYSKVEECIKDPMSVPELGIPYRSPGYCMAFDSAYVNHTVASAAIPNRYNPTSVADAYTQGFSNKFSEWTATNQEQFQVDCPILYNESIAQGVDLLCCTESQYEGLSTQVRMIPGLCSSCKENLRNIFCQFTCNPNNSMFLDINEVRIMPGDDDHPDDVYPAVEEATYYVGKDWIRDIYDFCEDDSSFSLLCNPNQDCTDGYGLMEFMGEYKFNSIGSPLQINVTTMDKYDESVQESNFCHCGGNITECVSPMNSRLESCVGVCGSLCAVGANDKRTYTDACFGATTETASGSSSDAVGDSKWAELEAYLAENLTESDFTGLNYFLVIFGGIVALLLIIGFLYAILRNKNTHSVIEQRSANEPVGPYTPVATPASTGAVVTRLSFLDELMTIQMKRWASFISTGKRPFYVIPVVFAVVVLCSVGLYNVDVETDPVKLWMAESSKTYKQRTHFGDLFRPFYRSEQVLLVPKDGGDIYRLDMLKEAIRVQTKIANTVYTSTDGNVTLGDICWKATGTDCTVNSITQYFQNNMEHFETYERYGLALEHFSNCLYSPTTSDVDICNTLTKSLAANDSIPSTMGDCPCLSSFGSPMNLYNTYLGGFPDGAESNYTLYLQSTAFVSTALVYNYENSDQNQPAINWEREFIDLLKAEAESSTLFDVYFQAEISVQDEVDKESHNGMGPVAASYCVMLVYISLGINRWKFSKDFFLTSKILVGFFGVICIIFAVASTIGLFMWAGVKLQLIIMEVVPFLTLAIGVDNIFLLVHSMARKEEELRKSQPQLFVGLHQDEKAVAEVTSTIVSEAVSYIGPSIFMASTAESIAFVFGCISPMPVVLWFAAMACVAVALNFCFQMSLLLSIITLDKRRELSGKYDFIFRHPSSTTAAASAQAIGETPAGERVIQPLVAAEPKTPDADPATAAHDSNVNDFLSHAVDRFIDSYAWFLSLKIVKLVVMLIFLVWTLVSIYSLELLKRGLPQAEAMPSASYMIDYFNAIDKYLATGAPIYFVVEAGYGNNPDTWNVNEESVESIFCKSKDICGEYALPKIVDALANDIDKEISHVSPGTTYSWMDDYWGFVNPDSECCRVNDEGEYLPIDDSNTTYSTLRKTYSTCLSASTSVPPVPETMYMSLFSMFATASAGNLCSYGGGSIYQGQFSVDDQPIPVVTDTTPAVVLNSTGYGSQITAWSYRVICTANPTQQHYIDAYAQHLRAAEWMSEKTGVDIWIYSLTYVYFNQYLTIVSDSFMLIGLALVTILVVTTLFLGNVFYALVITLAAANVVVQVGGLLHPNDILLNGLSMVNLVIAAGIAVEFCGHYVRMFAKARGTGDERAREALRRVLVSVFFGITITKVLGLSMLTLADSRVFKKYYFRMYMFVVMCGFLNGMVLLPVVLSTIMDVKAFFQRKRSPKAEVAEIDHQE